MLEYFYVELGLFESERLRAYLHKSNEGVPALSIEDLETECDGMYAEGESDMLSEVFERLSFGENDLNID